MLTMPGRPMPSGQTAHLVSRVPTGTAESRSPPPSPPAGSRAAPLPGSHSLVRGLPYLGNASHFLFDGLPSFGSSVASASSRAPYRTFTPNLRHADVTPLPVRPEAPVAFATPGTSTRIAPPRAAARWSASAWLLLRDDRGRAILAPGGTLGGSQAGARLNYRLGGGLALSARIYAPLRRIEGAEVAAGLDWQPWARLPVHVLAERRQDAGGEGRSAFALIVYGGASGQLPGRLRAEGYAQAGIVGVRSRDLFVDGSVRIAFPAGPVEVGGGAWGAAQPGAARLDAGPSVSYRLPVRRANLRLQADWRFRVVGDAAPGSGPALTLAADF